MFSSAWKFFFNREIADISYVSKIQMGGVQMSNPMCGRMLLKKHCITRNISESPGWVRRVRLRVGCSRSVGSGRDRAPVHMQPCGHLASSKQVSNLVCPLPLLRQPQSSPPCIGKGHGQTKHWNFWISVFLTLEWTLRIYGCKANMCLLREQMLIILQELSEYHTDIHTHTLIPTPMHTYIIQMHTHTDTSIGRCTRTQTHNCTHTW